MPEDAGSNPAVSTKKVEDHNGNVRDKYPGYPCPLYLCIGCKKWFDHDPVRRGGRKSSPVLSAEVFCTEDCIGIHRRAVREDKLRRQQPKVRRLRKLAQAAHWLERRCQFWLTIWISRTLNKIYHKHTKP